VRVALDYLAEQFPACRMLLAGFSFGAWVGLRVGCSDERVAELAGLGLPADSSDLTYLHACAKPKILIQGARDKFGRRDKIEALVAKLPPAHARHTTLVFVPGADHFFTGKLDQVDAALRAWLLERHPELKAIPPVVSPP